MKDYRSSSYKKISSDKAAKKQAPKAATGSKSTGGSFTTSDGRQGYAAGAVSQIKEGGKDESGSVLYSQTYKGGSGTITTPEGKTVKVQQTATPEAAQQARREEIRKAAAQGRTLSQKQEAELRAYQSQQSGPAQVAVDYASVEAYNKAMAGQGIRTAGDYFDMVLGKQRSGGSSGPTSGVRAPSFSPVAPRTPSPQETQPSEQKFDFKLGTGERKYAGQMNAADKPGMSLSQKQRIDLGIREEYAEYNLAVNEPGNELLVLSAIPVRFVAGSIEGGIDLIQGTIQIVQGAPRGKDLINPIKVGTFVTETGGAMLEGTAELAADTIVTAGRGDIPGLAEKGGYIWTQGKISHVIGVKAKGVAKGAFVDFGQDMKFLEVTEFAPKDTGYQFFTQSYTVEGRQGVIAPPEYRGALNTRTVPELQTQLYPKKVEGIGQDSSIFSPEPYQPQSLLEIGRKDPALAKELAKEAGQTVFNPEEVPRIRDLTTEERLAIAKEQAGAKPLELQKTLLGYKPKTTDQTFILKNNKVVAKIKGKEVEIPDTPIFAADPLTATALTIVQEKEVILERARNVIDKFKRESSIIGDGEVMTRSKRGALPGLVISETRDLAAGADSKPITVMSLGKSSSQDRAAVPDIRRRTQGRSGSDIRMMNIQAQPQALEQGVTPIQVTELTVEQARVQVPELVRSQMTQFDTPSTPRRPLALPRARDKKEGRSGMVGVQVRRRGKFQTVASLENEQDAFRQGLNMVRGNAAASFRLIDLVSGDIIQPGEGVTYDLAQSRREKGVFIQKRGFRISSPGEKAEITYKGMAASRGRKKRGLRL